MRQLILQEATIVSLVAITRLDVADLVVPPAERLPVRLVVFEELAEVVRVLAHSAHNVLLGRSLVPLDRLERESLKSLSDVSDRTLLSVDVLHEDTSSGSISLLWKKMNAAARKLLQKETRVHGLVDQVRQLGLLHLDELHVQRMNLNVDLDHSLRVDRQNGDLVLDATNVPRVIGVVEGLRLQVSERSEFRHTELEQL